MDGDSAMVWGMVTEHTAMEGAMGGAVMAADTAYTEVGFMIMVTETGLLIQPS